jgi:hypothetical protein
MNLELVFDGLVKRVCLGLCLKQRFIATRWSHSYSKLMLKALSSGQLPTTQSTVHMD